MLRGQPLGVQVASVPLFFLTAVFASLTYLCIQYALSVLFQHIGKGLCIILIFVQIPGATGLYPIEMTPDFFQAVYPVFPFTYGINALRETIAGFYGFQWGGEMGMLLLYFLVFFVGGLLGASVPDECESDVQQADCRNRYSERRGIRAACAALSHGPAVPRSC